MRTGCSRVAGGCSVIESFGMHVVANWLEASGDRLQIQSLHHFQQFYIPPAFARMWMHHRPVRLSCKRGRRQLRSPITKRKSLRGVRSSRASKSARVSLIVWNVLTAHHAWPRRYSLPVSWVSVKASTSYL